MPDKVFRDPLYNYIAFDRSRDGWLIDLVNCREVQRLRRIHQLGVSNFTYPGADHTRFAHSLGVTHLMLFVLEHLEQVSDAEKIKNARQALLATALLHDVGHGPFSHLFEPCLGIDHEKWSIAVILDENSRVHQVLKEQNAYLPNYVADLIDSNNTNHPAWQRALMSSQLDVDRLDYLRRDSLFTGAGYGHFDWHRLLTTVEFDNGDTDLVWPAKSAMAIEEYIFARYYMYQNVYLHKTTRGFEQLLQAMWKRADRLRRDGKDINANPVLEKFWKYEKPEPGKLPVDDYLKVEEFTVLEQIQRWTAHPDKSLADCARRFLERDGFAMVEPPPPPNPLKPDDLGEWEPELRKLLEKKGYGVPEMYCLSDRIKGKYLIGQFAAGSGKKAGEFYTPQQISDILSAIVTLDSQEPKTGPKKRLESVLDFACGSGSLLLNVRNRIKKAGGTIGKIYGQEKNITTYNLARMNMLLHGVKDTEFEIYHGDTLTNDWDILRELNPAKKPYFDAIVANPPFSYRWDPTEAMGDDVRFKNHGLAPKSAADFAFLLHGFHYLKDEGVMAIILPHGVLFRGGAEERIRTKLLKDGHIDTVIGLPANLFYSTGIPVCILVLKKCKKPDDVLFINAAEHFDKGKRQNQLKPEHIAKIIETYQFRKEADRYSRRVEMEEIEKNDFNLNISRYISTAVAEEAIDLATTHEQLIRIEEELQAAKTKHNKFLKELGLPPLP